MIRFINIDNYSSGSLAGAIMNHTPHFLFAQNNSKLCDYSNIEVIMQCSTLYSTFSAPQNGLSDQISFIKDTLQLEEGLFPVKNEK